MIHILFDVDSILFLLSTHILWTQLNEHLIRERIWQTFMQKTLFMSLVVDKYENGLICCLFQFLF